MKYEPFNEIDNILEDWCEDYQLKIYKEYKDYEVRWIPIIDNQGTKYELSIELRDDSEFKVNLFWLDDTDKRITRLRNKKEWSKETNKENLEETLTEAYTVFKFWMKEIDHKREFI